MREDAKASWYIGVWLGIGVFLHVTSRHPIPASGVRPAPIFRELLAISPVTTPSNDCPEYPLGWWLSGESLVLELDAELAVPTWFLAETG